MFEFGCLLDVLFDCLVDLLITCLSDSVIGTCLTDCLIACLSVFCCLLDVWLGLMLSCVDCLHA